MVAKAAARSLILDSTEEILQEICKSEWTFWHFWHFLHL
jgi:hypothetical protein